jgi:hypothetical protein
MKEKIRHRMSQGLLLLAYAGIALVYLVMLYGRASLVL